MTDYEDEYFKMTERWALTFYEMCSSPKDARELLWEEIEEEQPFWDWPIEELIWVQPNYSRCYFSDAFVRIDDPKSFVGFMSKLAMGCLWYDAIEHRKNHFGPAN